MLTRSAAVLNSQANPIVVGRPVFRSPQLVVLP